MTPVSGGFIFFAISVLTTTRNLPFSYISIPGALFPQVKRTKCASDHSPPSGSKVTDALCLTPTPPNAFMLRDLGTGTKLSPRHERVHGAWR